MLPVRLAARDVADQLPAAGPRGDRHGASRSRSSARMRRRARSRRRPGLSVHPSVAAYEARAPARHRRPGEWGGRSARGRSPRPPSDDGAVAASADASSATGRRSARRGVRHRDGPRVAGRSPWVGLAVDDMRRPASSRSRAASRHAVPSSPRPRPPDPDGPRRSDRARRVVVLVVVGGCWRLELLPSATITRSPGPSPSARCNLTVEARRTSRPSMPPDHPGTARRVPVAATATVPATGSVERVEGDRQRHLLELRHRQRVADPGRHAVRDRSEDIEFVTSPSSCPTGDASTSRLHDRPVDRQRRGRGGRAGEDGNVGNNTITEVPRAKAGSSRSRTSRR